MYSYSEIWDEIIIMLKRSYIYVTYR